jgi:pyruvate formate lyase activating enzyme
MLGRYTTVKEVLGAVEEDSCFYARSGGGLTLSGGEPLFQLEFSLEILREAKRLSLDTAVETCGHGTWDGLKEMCALVDCIFYDIKSCDPYKHKQFTGISNEAILDNFEHWAREYLHLPIVVRTPVIPGFNDSSEDVAAIAKFIGGYRNVSHELMPYHAFGASKYTFLGKQYELSEVQPPTTEQMRAFKDTITENVDIIASAQSASGGRRM